MLWKKYYMNLLILLKGGSTLKYKIRCHLKKIYGLGILSFLILFLIVIMIYPNINMKIDGEQWFDRQKEYIETMETLTTSLDNVVSLYINGNIGVEDFINHMQVLRQELDIVIVSYENEEKEHPVKVGTHTYESKSGCEAVKSSITEVSSLINNCLEESVFSDKDKLSYTYIAYKMSIAEFISIYTESLNAINDKYMEEQQPENMMRGNKNE